MFLFIVADVVCNAQFLYCRQLMVVRSSIPPVCLLSPLLVQVSSSIPPVCLLSPLNPMKMLVQVSSSIRANPDQPPCLSAAYNLVNLAGLIFVKLTISEDNKMYKQILLFICKHTEVKVIIQLNFSFVHSFPPIFNFNE